MLRSILPLLLLGGAALLPAACGDAPVQRDCFARVWVPFGADQPRIAMKHSRWEPTLVALPQDADWSLLRLELPPGEHGYSLVRNGKRSLDPRNPLTTFREDTGEEVSLLVVDDCNVPAIKIESLAADEGEVELEGRFLAARSGAPIDPLAIRATTASGKALSIEILDEAGGLFRARGKVGEGRTTIDVVVSDEDGVASELARARVWPSRRARERRDEVLYQVVVDRFRGDGGGALDPPRTPGARAGGTLDGVRAAIEEGFFDRLGVTSLWLSPVYDNPDGERPGRDGRMYEGYHGYWVENGRGVEPRIGGEAALRAVVESAHARGLAVLLDIVPNHVAETNAIVLEHQAEDWFNPAGCVCGVDDCPWGPNLQVCWFTDYLPDLRLEEPAAMRHATREAAFWLTSADVDGVRIDAVPMMPRAAVRRIASDLRRTIAAGEEPFIVGEVFTGPGAVALEEIRAQIGPHGLASAFAFPLMWAMRSAIATGRGSFAEVESLLVAEEERFAGSGMVVGRILDNHDVSRFVSVANGDDAGDPWDAPAVQPEDAEPYERMGVGLSLIFTLPGMPTLFQGDEVGLAGSGDPDNRRVFPREEELSAPQLALRDHAARLGELRACSAVLREGDRTALVVEPTQYAFSRTTDEGAVLVVLSAEDGESSVDVPPAASANRWVDAITGEAFQVDASGTLPVTLPPRTARILLPEGDPCLATK